MDETFVRLNVRWLPSVFLFVNGDVYSPRRQPPDDLVPWVGNHLPPEVSRVTTVHDVIKLQSLHPTRSVAILVQGSPLNRLQWRVHSGVLGTRLTFGFIEDLDKQLSSLLGVKAPKSAAVVLPPKLGNGGQKVAVTRIDGQEALERWLYQRQLPIVPRLGPDNMRELCPEQRLRINGGSSSVRSRSKIACIVYIGDPSAASFEEHIGVLARFAELQRPSAQTPRPSPSLTWLNEAAQHEWKKILSGLIVNGSKAVDEAVCGRLVALKAVGLGRFEITSCSEWKTLDAWWNGGLGGVEKSAFRLPVLVDEDLTWSRWIGENWLVGILRNAEFRPIVLVLISFMSMLLVRVVFKG